MIRIHTYSTSNSQKLLLVYALFWMPISILIYLFISLPCFLNAYSYSSSSTLLLSYPTFLHPRIPRRSPYVSYVESSVVCSRTAVHSSSSSSSSSEATSQEGKRICILGGGFAGLQTALTLQSLFQQQQTGNSPLHTPAPQITLIDSKERFVFLPLLYELCVGDATLDEVGPTYKRLLQPTNTHRSRSNNSTRITFRQQAVYGIDIDKNRVFLTNTTTTATTTTTTPVLLDEISYDYLVVATGSDAMSDFTTIPGVKQWAFPFYTIQDCYRLRTIFQKLQLFIQTVNNDHDEKDNDTMKASMQKDHRHPSTFKIVVVGGGYSGVELSLNVLQKIQQIFHINKQHNPLFKVEMTLIHRGTHVLEYATEYNQKKGIDRLQQAGIVMKTNTIVDGIIKKPIIHMTTTTSFSQVLDIPSVQVQLTTNTFPTTTSSHIDSYTLDADLVLWTAGAMRRNIPNIPGIFNSKLPRDTKGRIVTDSFLKVKGYDRLFALGDCSRVIRSSSSSTTTKPYPATAQVALQQATVTAWNVYSQYMTSIASDSSSKEYDLLPFEYVDLGEMLSLGSDDASISSLQGNIQLEGKAASLLRRWIYAIRMPTPQQAITAFVSSLQQKISHKINT